MLFFVNQVLCWAAVIRGDKCNLKYQKTYICRNTKGILRQFWWNIWSKAGDFLWHHLIFEPCCMNSLHTPPQRAEHLHPSSCECALACVPSQQAPYFSDRLESWHQCLAPQQGCGQLAAESHIVIQVAFQVSCFLLLHSDSFMDLTSKAALLSLKRRRVGIYTFGADKESPQILHFLCSIRCCLRLSGFLLQGSMLLLSSYLLQLLQENPKVFQGSSFSITWVCLRANNQEFTPTHGGVIKAP